jgi:hypothetical protein
LSVDNRCFIRVFRGTQRFFCFKDRNHEWAGHMRQ